MNCHLLARKIETDRRLVSAGFIARGSQPHKSGAMTGPTAERPASGNAIAAGDRFSRTDRAGGADDKCVGIGKPLPCNRLWQIASDAAHSAAICDDPADRTILGRRRFDDLHELDRRQFGAAHRRREPKPKQSSLGQCTRHTTSGSLRSRSKETRCSSTSGVRLSMASRYPAIREGVAVNMCTFPIVKLTNVTMPDCSFCIVHRASHPKMASIRALVAWATDRSMLTSARGTSRHFDAMWNMVAGEG